MTTYGYARVSKAHEDGTTTLENQRLQLRAVGAARIFEDVITGIASKRPGLDEMLDALEEGDTVAVVAMDRLGRDTLQVADLLRVFQERGIELRVLSLPTDVQDIVGGGRLLALIAAEIAAIERARISERTRQGLERARAEGKMSGRRWSISRGQMQHIHELRDQGRTIVEIARSMAVSESIVRRALRVDPDTVPAGAFKQGMS